MQNLYDTNFDAPDAHFDTLYLFSDTQAEKLKIQNVMTVKIPERPKIECCEIESNPSKDRAMHGGNNPSF
jgi:hypothetical protein